MSALWALCADILDAEAGTRLFGFIGAGKGNRWLIFSLKVVRGASAQTGLAFPHSGATLGQLLGSMVVVAVVKLQSLAVASVRSAAGEAIEI